MKKVTENRVVEIRGTFPNVSAQPAGRLDGKMTEQSLRNRALTPKGAEYEFQRLVTSERNL